MDAHQLSNETSQALLLIRGGAPDLYREVGAGGTTIPVQHPELCLVPAPELVVPWVIDLGHLF